MTLFAGLFIVVLMVGVWLYVQTLLATHGVLANPREAQFVGRTYVSFGLVAVCGIIGMVNGVVQIRTGMRNRILAFVMIVLFIAAIVTAAVSSTG